MENEKNLKEANGGNIIELNTVVEDDDIEKQVEWLESWKNNVHDIIKNICGYPVGSEEEIFNKKKQVVGNMKLDYVSALNTQIRDTIANNKGYMKVIYRFMYDKNSWVPIVLFGFGKINKETDSLVMRVIVGSPDFPIGTMIQLALVDCSIRWMTELDFFDQSAKMLAYNRELELREKEMMEKEMKEKAKKIALEKQQDSNNEKENQTDEQKNESKFSFFKRGLTKTGGVSEQKQILDAKDLPISEQDNIV